MIVHENILICSGGWREGGGIKRAQENALMKHFKKRNKKLMQHSTRTIRVERVKDFHDEKDDKCTYK